MPDLVLVFLTVSCISLVSQLLAFTRLIIKRAVTPVEKLVGHGYLRTIGCRIVAAVAYTAVAAVQLAGDGTLSAEALLVFACVQILWISNSLMDIRTRHDLIRTQRKGLVADSPQERLAAVAKVIDDLNEFLDKLFVKIAELKTILSRTRKKGFWWPMTDTSREQLAAVAKVTDDLDGVLDELFVKVAQLKAILSRPQPPSSTVEVEDKQ